MNAVEELELRIALAKQFAEFNKQLRQIIDRLDVLERRIPDQRTEEERYADWERSMGEDL